MQEPDEDEQEPIVTRSIAKKRKAGEIQVKTEERDGGKVSHTSTVAAINNDQVSMPANMAGRPIPVSQGPMDVFQETPIGSRFGPSSIFATPMKPERNTNFGLERAASPLEGYGK